MTSELLIEAELDSLDFERNTATFAVDPSVRWTGGKYYITNAPLASQPRATVDEVERVIYGEFPELLREHDAANPASPSVRALSFDEASEGGKSLARKLAQALRNAFPHMFRG